MDVYPDPHQVRHTLRSRADHFTAVVARFLLGGFFVYSAVDNLLNFTSVSQQLELPASAVLLFLGAAVKLILGLMVIFRYHTKYASLGLALYLIATNIFIFGPHSWDTNILNKYIFMRNIAIIGGLLFVDAYSRGWKDWKEEFFDKDPYQEYKRTHPDHHAPTS